MELEPLSMKESEISCGDHEGLARANTEKKVGECEKKIIILKISHAERERGRHKLLAQGRSIINTKVTILRWIE